LGLLAKNATKKRVGPLSGPLNSALGGSPWLTTGAIPSAALVRSAAFALNLAGTTSNSLRGRRNAIAAALVSPLTSASSKLWVETTDFKTWEFALGMPAAGDAAAFDWVVKLAIDGSTATVATVNWLTKEDALVNAEHHDALRNELLRALALGELTDAAGEAEVSAASLAHAQPFAGAPPQPFDLSFAVVTSLDEAASRQCLGQLGRRVVSDSPAGIRWGLGLPRNDRTDHVTFTFGPGRLDGTAQVGSAAPGERRIAAYALRSFIDRVLFLIKHAGDEAATYEGPADWESSQ